MAIHVGLRNAQQSVDPTQRVLLSAHWVLTHVLESTIEFVAQHFGPQSTWRAVPWALEGSHWACVEWLLRNLPGGCILAGFQRMIRDPKLKKLLLVALATQKATCLRRRLPDKSVGLPVLVKNERTAA